MSARIAAVTAGVLVCLLAPVTSAVADDLDINNLPTVSTSALAGSVQDFRLPVDDIRLFSPQEIETESTDGAEKVLTLSSDILFAFDKAVLPPAAGPRIGELVKDLPQKAKVSVGGHTDSLGTAARNATLSQERAAAVAAAIKAARPDLVLTVKGFGSTQPVADNGTPAKDNPEGRAKNRRVEIRYAG